MTLLEQTTPELPTTWLGLLERFGLSTLLVIIMLWVFIFRILPTLIELMKAGIVLVKTLAVAIPDIQASLKRIADHGEFALNQLKAKLDDLGSSFTASREKALEHLDERFEQLKAMLKGT